MGLVAIAVGFIAQMFDRRAWYVAAGVAVALLSVLFSNLVPLESQTGSLPAVLRSNYWLIIHVLTITASYGVLAVASLLAHVYLFKEVILAKKGAAPATDSRLSHPLIVQAYRCIQLGLLLLTAGTILGGVWAADSWGRFWGWDPKETWALISIVVYFIILHARYLKWIRDFGMAAWTVLAFASIVWTFYGVNYLMAAGLHSYGFGNGGGTWVGVWALAEILFVVVCKLRQRATGGGIEGASPLQPPAPQGTVHGA
jgi:ABC-type transport system involved in cytochrome c biogenesis permease subunit